MNESEYNLRRLEQLVIEKCNGSLGAEGYAELEDLLARNPDLRAVYWQIMSMHADLEWNLVANQAARDDIGCQLPEGLVTTATSNGTSPARLPHSLGSSWWGAAMAASLAAVLVGGWAIWKHAERQAPQVAEAVEESRETALAPAQLTPLTPNSRWSFGSSGDPNPKEFRYGDTVMVADGLVEMQLEGGTVGQLRAPVVLQLVSQDRVRLLSGKIRVNAPARTDGFTVETPLAEVIDLGTEFSVEAAETGTDLLVHDGKVNLKVPQNSSGDVKQAVTSKLFTAGQGVHVDMNGTLSRIMNVKSSADRLAPESPASSHVITSVVDNIHRDDIWAFYEIVWGGMAEDTYAFVDRVHEWNGITTQGMPAYLLNADYIKTFNDDKIAADLNIDVTLARPATLYVLLDKRVPPPRWLADSFVDTGDEMGVDINWDTGHFFHDDERWAMIGAGRGIDQVHSIWKRVVPKAGTVRLGPNGKKAPDQDPGRANMYGIVAVPLERGQVAKPAL